MIQENGNWPPKRRITKEDMVEFFESMLNMFKLDGYNPVARYDDEKRGITVSTAAIPDSDYPYETGVRHPRFNQGRIIVVENYNTLDEANAGHEKWLKIMTDNQLPKVLKEVSASGVVKLYRKLTGQEIIYERGED